MLQNMEDNNEKHKNTIFPENYNVTHKTADASS